MTRIWCRMPGLVPVMTLAQRTGLGGLVAGHVRLGWPCGVNTRLVVACLVAGMAAGADSIDDMGLLRHGAMGASVTVPQYAKVRPMSQPMPGHTSDRVRSAGAGNGAPGHGHRSEAARRGNPGKTGCRT